MRTGYKIAISIGIILVVVGALLLIYFGIFQKDDNIYVENLQLTTTEINLEVDETFEMKDILDIKPINYNVAVMCIIENSYYASITNNNIVTGKKVGTTNILIRTLKDKDSYIDKTIKLNIIEKQTYPSVLSFKNDIVNVGLNATNCINPLLTTNTYNAVPSVVYSVSDICEYDYLTGKITPLNLGTTIVTVRFTDELFASFTVNVVENYRTISVDGTEKVGEYETLNINLNEPPFRVNVQVKDENENPLNIELECDIIENTAGFNIINNEYSVIKFSCSSTGEVILRISCKDDSSVFVLVKIIVG